MNRIFLFLLLFVVSSLAPILVSTAFAEQVYRAAPNNTFETVGADSQEANAILQSYFKFSNNVGSNYTEKNLQPLEPSDFTRIDRLSEDSRNQARKLIREGKVIAVDSVVGNAVRLGSPNGGKGAVEIANGMTFLDSKIIRLAVDSYSLGVTIKQILWTSQENQSYIEELLNTMEERIQKIEGLNDRIKEIVKNYLKARPITLMAQSTLFPVVGDNKELSFERTRNLGAGELVPTIFRSQANKMVNLTADSLIVFSNIDFDLNFLDVVAASIEAKDPDLLQVHVETKASGGSAYWHTQNGQRRIVPLEGIEVPKPILDRAGTLNTNTLVIRGKALDPKLYASLDVPFEKKTYDGRTFYLPKVSVADIGKDQRIRTAVALGNTSEYFYSGSKDTELLRQTGILEANGRFSRWQTQVSQSSLSHTMKSKLICSKAQLAR